MPAPFFGPLKTAPLVLLYAGPGNTATGKENDNSQGKDLTWVRRRLGSLDGESPIDWDLIQLRARNWFKGRLASVLGLPSSRLPEIDGLTSKVAFANLTAYRGEITRWEEVAFLPSTHVMRSWARRTLFDDARRLKRVVLVMRANKWWGVRNSPWSDGYLFAPRTNRSGYLSKKCNTARAAMGAARHIVGIE